MKNIIETQITNTDRDTIGDLISDLEAAIAGKLFALTEEERVNYGSINEQNKLLVNKVRDYRTSSPGLNSPDVDRTEFENDFQARAFLESSAARLASIAYQMQSTKILHDNDNYQDALNDCAYAQYKKGANEPGNTKKGRRDKTILPAGALAYAADTIEQPPEQVRFGLWHNVFRSKVIPFRWAH